MDAITFTGFGYDGGGKMQYHLHLNGVKKSLIYFNMTGYCVEFGIPYPDGNLSLPEGSLAMIRKEVKKANKYWSDKCTTNSAKQNSKLVSLP